MKFIIKHKSFNRIKLLAFKGKIEKFIPVAKMKPDEGYVLILTSDNNICECREEDFHRVRKDMKTHTKEKIINIIHTDKQKEKYLKRTYLER